ncbi:MAG: cyclic nucleotide-binding domain-containing protein [Thermodesulfobacteriota bacterium]
MNLTEMLQGYVLKERELPDKALAIKEGVSNEVLFIILKGQMKVKKNVKAGLVTVDVLKPGAVAGEITLFSGAQAAASASVMAEGPVRVGILDRPRLIRDLEGLSPRVKELFGVLAARLRQATDEVASHEGAGRESCSG